MAVLVDRELFLVKKALAIAILAIEARDGSFQPASDAADMKVLLDRLVVSDAELENYARAARLAYTGEPER
jgi:hypothetical protein